MRVGASAGAPRRCLQQLRRRRRRRQLRTGYTAWGAGPQNGGVQPPLQHFPSGAALPPSRHEIHQ
jgi:hypothetical protein